MQSLISKNIGLIMNNKTLAAPLLIMTSAAFAAPQVYDVSHNFTTADVQGGATNQTFAADDTIICDLGSVPCPADNPPITDKKGNVLYPVESLFGFKVSDFVGAATRDPDGDYAEGYAGDLPDTGNGVGVAIANTQTAVFKTRAPYGTWCAGLGGVTVKCSSEHYVAMEHVLSCNETVPYTTSDLTDNLVQKDLVDPQTGQVVDNCINNKLDDALYIVDDFIVTAQQLTSVTPGDEMEANESTVRDDIAVGKDYSVTLKDDGKPLYRWGNAVKRPTDIRLYVQMPLPGTWDLVADYPITVATLTITHSVTNNPNDQIRPEDMENEGATGRLPEYVVNGSNWASTMDCYEGDGDYIPAGTLFINDDAADPTAFSSDLRTGYTNAWYTTTNRDPVEVDSFSCIGPRWRLKGNKYGQDVPGLEIASALAECQTPPPFVEADQKYETGEITTTVINLLDFNGTSPLVSSLGWIVVSCYNQCVIVVIPASAVPISIAIIIRRNIVCCTRSPLLNLVTRFLAI